MEQGQGLYSRGYLSHIEAGENTQFITWRLKDSLPASLYVEWKAELERLSSEERRKQLYSKIEKHLDAGHGSQILKNPIAAHTVQEALVFGHADRYELKAWSIMPTHVHCLIRPTAGWTLPDIMKGIKGYSSRRVGERLGTTGGIWQREYFDVLLIRNLPHFQRTKAYIE
jgi:putative transposase